MPDSNAANNDNGNGRVTLALIGQKLDQLDKKLDSFIEETKEHRAAIDKRLLDIEKLQASEKERLDHVEKDASEACTSIEEVKTKYNFWNGVNTAIATLGSIIAGYIGVNR